MILGCGPQDLSTAKSAAGGLTQWDFSLAGGWGADNKLGGEGAGGQVLTRSHSHSVSGQWTVNTGGRHSWELTGLAGQRHRGTVSGGG